jgi:hypothetical protein
MIDGTKRTCLQFKDVRSFLDSILSEDTHAKRVDSLANAALGVMTGASLAVAMIGKSLAQARGLLTKHAVKQVDRLLSNPRIEAVFATWVPEMVGPRKDIVVAMDWTDFDADGQATLALKLVTRHGRATPLIWLSVLKDELSTARNDYEDACLRRLAEVLPDDVTVTILAGFADPQRRDRLLLLNAFAVVLLTLLGAAGESLGMTSSPTPSRPDPIPCSDRAACSTT